MRPLLKNGDTVLVEQITGAQTRPGDVVFYQACGRTYLHRVWWRKGTRLWVSDDTWTVGPQEIPEGAILGRLAERPFRRGLVGLAYSLSMTTIFLIGRKLKFLGRPS